MAILYQSYERVKKRYDDWINLLEVMNGEKLSRELLGDQNPG